MQNIFECILFINPLVRLNFSCELFHYLHEFAYFFCHIETKRCMLMQHVRTRVKMRLMVSKKAFINISWLTDSILRFSLRSIPKSVVLIEYCLGNVSVFTNSPNGNRQLLLVQRLLFLIWKRCNYIWQRKVHQIKIKSRQNYRPKCLGFCFLIAASNECALPTIVNIQIKIYLPVTSESPA